MFYLELDCLQDGEISSSHIAVHGQIIFDRLSQLESVFWKIGFIPPKLVP